MCWPKGFILVGGWVGEGRGGESSEEKLKNYNFMFHSDRTLATDIINVIHFSRFIVFLSVTTIIMSKNFDEKCNKQLSEIRVLMLLTVNLTF